MSEQHQVGKWELRGDENDEEIWVVYRMQRGFVGYFIEKPVGMSIERYKQYMDLVRDKLNEEGVGANDSDRVWSAFWSVKL
jgi:hypothetical protein